MKMLFADYRLRVVRAYQQKKAANTLSPRLVYPTPAQIREECLAVCNERYSKRDDNHFRTFFGQSGDMKVCAQAIDQCSIDKFKPLVNFLKNPAIKTKNKNIELLAWLIDFQPRPYEYGKEYNLIEPGMPAPEKGQSENNDEQKEIISTEKPTNKEEENNENASSKSDSGKPYPKLKIFAVLASIIILTSAGAWMYWWRDNEIQGIYLAGQKCMYWAGDHYEPISCHPRLGDTLVIALDSVKLIHFKRITTPDTITRNAIGKVWYIKKNNELEYYTSGGYHPVYPQMRLRPITAFIIDKHIRPGQE